jgi:hypothetical protein
MLLAENSPSFAASQENLRSNLQDESKADLTFIDSIDLLLSSMLHKPSPEKSESADGVQIKDRISTSLLSTV